MQIKIEAKMDGADLVRNFISTLELSNIKVPVDEAKNPIGVKFLVTNKSGAEVEVAPTPIKLVYNG